MAWSSRTNIKLTCSSLWLIVGLIKDHRVFQQRGNKKQAPVEHQLMTILCFLSVFRVSKGSIHLYKDIVVQAILDCMFEDFVKWPDEKEKGVIAERTRTDFGLPNCIGVADGTLLPLAFRPSTDDYADYKGRKMLYTLTMLAWSMMTKEEFGISLQVGPDQLMMTGSSRTPGLSNTWVIISIQLSTLLVTVQMAPKILWYRCTRNHWVPPYTQTTKLST
jgi:hypothetical protein